MGLTPGSGDLLQEEMATPVFLPRESHVQRNLAGSSPWGRRESDATETKHHHHLLIALTTFHFVLYSCACLACPRECEQSEHKNHLVSNAVPYTQHLSNK